MGSKKPQNKPMETTSKIKVFPKMLDHTNQVKRLALILKLFFCHFQVITSQLSTILNKLPKTFSRFLFPVKTNNCEESE